MKFQLNIKKNSENHQQSNKLCFYQRLQYKHAELHKI